MSIRQLVKRGLASIDIAVTHHSTLRDLERDSGAAETLRFMLAMPRQSLPTLVDFLPRSHSQNRQDLFALSYLGFRRNGYFVDFGATDGVVGSNSYLMESELGWNGIVAEPARCWHERLRANRSCVVETACVWKESGSLLTFNEVPDHPALSTIEAFNDVDDFGPVRRTGTSYQVRTVSLLDLLESHNAPRTIDYLSIDTEGSELDILRAFDFSQYRILTITCEHNYSPAREAIHDLLSGHGYERRHEDLSMYDDWYVLRDLERDG
jgi:FkbM family methyltransferase